MVDTKLTPLAFNVPIVDTTTGNPTSQFARLLQILLKEKAATDQLAAEAVSSDELDAILAALELDDLEDVDVPAPTAGDVLTWNSGDALWEAQAIPAGGAGFGFDPPLASDFTLVSGDGTNAVLTDDADIGLVVTTPSAANTGVVRGAYKALPAGDFVLISKAQFTASLANSYTGGGIMIYESATGKAYLFALFNTTTDAQVRRQTLAGTYNSDDKFAGRPTQFDSWLMIQRTGTTLNFGVSSDGKNFTIIKTASLTTYFTTAPDRTGPFLWLGHATELPVVTITYWNQDW